jgi:hypothetical protein
MNANFPGGKVPPKSLPSKFVGGNSANFLRTKLGRRLHLPAKKFRKRPQNVFLPHPRKVPTAEKITLPIVGCGGISETDNGLVDFVSGSQLGGKFRRPPQKYQQQSRCQGIQGPTVTNFPRGKVASQAG